MSSDNKISQTTGATATSLNKAMGAPMGRATPKQALVAPSAIATMGSTDTLDAASAIMQLGTTAAATPATASNAPTATEGYAAMQMSLGAQLSSYASSRSMQLASITQPTGQLVPYNAELLQNGLAVPTYAPYCQMWNPRWHEYGANGPQIGGAMPQWTLQEQDEADGSKSLVAQFAVPAITNVTIQQLITQNGTYVADLSDPNCLVSMAQAFTYADKSKPSGANEYLPQVQTVASTTLKNPSADNVQVGVVGYRCEEDPDTQHLPFSIPWIGDRPFAAVQLLPDFSAQTLCATPTATSTYYIATIPALGLYDKNGLIAADVFPSLKPTVISTTMSDVSASTRTFVPFVPTRGIDAPIEHMNVPQRAQSSAFAAWNTLLLGAAAVLVLMARRSLQRQSQTSAA